MAPLKTLVRSRAFLIGAALSACGGDKPTVVDASPPPAEVSAPVDVAPPAPASKLGEVKALLERPLAEADLGAALALADEVAKNEPKVAYEAARLRLALVGRAASLGKVDVLGAGGPEAQLRLALAGLEGAPPADAERISKTARAMLGILTEAPESVPPSELHALLTEAGPERQALVDALSVSYKAASIWLSGAGFGSFLEELGPHLCEGCGVIPEDAVPAALACAAPTDGLFCEGLIAKREALGADATPPGNQVMLAALSFVDGLGIKTADHVLPVASTVGRGLAVGTEGLRPRSAPLMAIAVSAEGLKIGLRAVVGEGVRKGPADLALVSATLMPMATLLEAKAEENGALAGVSDRLSAVREAARKASELAAVGDVEGVLVAVDPEVPAAALEKALDAARAAEITAIGLARGGQGGEVMPAHWRAVPDELAKSLSPAWERPIVVVVSPSALDVYAPSGAREGAKALGPEAQGKLPTSSEQGWRGEELVRLRVPRPPAAEGVDTLDAGVLKGLGDAVGALSELAAAGRLVHVVAGEGALSGEVLRVGRHLQEGGVFAEPLAEPALVWAEAACRAPGCAQAVPVLLSKAAVPNSRGLKDKPEKGKKPVEKPAPGPAPSAEFCNAADIKVQMARKTAAFRFCYERELQLEKDIEGRVTMSFIIGLSGAVKSVRVANNALGSAKVGDCLSKEIAKVQFKAPDGGECVVQWPFNFRKN